MRRKLFSSLFVLFSLFQLLSAQSYAIVIGQPIKSFPPIRNNQALFGEDQYYSVDFRGNGEAVVTFKAIITNTNTASLSAVTIHLPSHITANEAIAYQVIAQPQCVQFSSEPITQPKCLQFQAPDYQYVPDDTTYKKIPLEQTNGAIMLSLPTPIAPNDTGSYLFSYRTFDYVGKNMFGAYAFNVQTLPVNDQINILQVGITTDSDLYLKNAKGTVNYATQTSMLALPKTADAAVQSPRFNDFYNQIGQGTITKSASNLASLESYTVKGMYADAGIKLYGEEISITLVSIFLFLLIVFGLAQLILRKQKKITKTTVENTHIRLFFLAAGISFGSVFLATLYTIGVLLLSFFITTNNYYLGYNSIFLFLPIIALSGAVYLFLLFSPTILMIIKRGFIWGGVIFGLTIMWIIISCIILFGVFYLFFASNTPQPPIIRPLMMNGTSSSVPVPNKGL